MLYYGILYYVIFWYAYIYPIIGHKHFANTQTNIKSHSHNIQDRHTLRNKKKQIKDSDGKHAEAEPETEAKHDQDSPELLPKTSP